MADQSTNTAISTVLVDFSRDILVVSVEIARTHHDFDTAHKSFEKQINAIWTKKIGATYSWIKLRTQKSPSPQDGHLGLLVSACVSQHQRLPVNGPLFATVTGDLCVLMETPNSGRRLRPLLWFASIAPPAPETAQPEIKRTMSPRPRRTDAP